MARDKFRIRFRKGGDLRMVSHRDLMRCFERMLRRAALPFRSSEGFNPHPKMAFALSLALGVEGIEEVVELQLEESLPSDELHTRLSAQAPAGLQIQSVRQVDLKASAQVRRACYRVEVPAERRQGLAEQIEGLLSGTHCWVERTRPTPKRLDIRPYLRTLSLADGGLEMDLWVTPTGTARPDDVLGLLGLGDLPGSGAVLRRTILELHDESAGDGSPVGTPEMESGDPAGVGPRAAE